MASPHPAIAAGNTAVITGGASGIGLAVAKKLVAEGMNVCIADVNEESLAEAASALGADDRVLTHATDVSDAASVDRLAGEVEKRFGAVSMLHANAGVAGGGDALSNPDGWQRVLGVNLFGVIHAVQRFVPAMVDSDASGLVVCTGSKQGITQPPGDTAYNVSKSGVKSLAEGLAHTLREKTEGRVSAHLLVPGFTYTGMIARFIKEKPPAAWTSDQVADYLFEKLAAGSFYVLCPDNDVTPEVDALRIAWSAGDMTEDRPALSRWHPDFEDAFEKHMAGG